MRRGPQQKRNEKNRRKKTAHAPPGHPVLGVGNVERVRAFQKRARACCCCYSRSTPLRPPPSPPLWGYAYIYMYYIIHRRRQKTVFFFTLTFSSFTEFRFGVRARVQLLFFAPLSPFLRAVYLFIFLFSPPRVTRVFPLEVIERFNQHARHIITRSRLA